MPHCTQTEIALDRGGWLIIIGAADERISESGLHLSILMDGHGFSRTYQFNHNQ